jgi:hypothetical protein
VSRYTDMLAAAAYAPTLTGGAKQRVWLIGAQLFNGTSNFIETPSGSTLGLSNTFFVSCWATPTSVTGNRCILEFSGQTHGFAIWQLGADIWFIVIRDNTIAASVQLVGAAVLNKPVHLAAQVLPTGLSGFANGALAGATLATISTSNATDAGGIGAVYSDSRLPNGTVIDNGATTATNHFAGVIGDVRVNLSNQGAAGAFAAFTSIDPPQLAFRVGYQPYRTPAIAA